MYAYTRSLQTLCLGLNLAPLVQFRRETEVLAERMAQRRIRLFTVVIGRTVPTWSHALSTEVWSIEPVSGAGLAAAIRKVAAPRD